MSKVTIVINEWICTCLDYARDMVKTGDYSGLPALIERIQQHANAMENGLEYHSGNLWAIDHTLKQDIPDEKKVKRVRKIIKRWQKGK